MRGDTKRATQSLRSTHTSRIGRAGADEKSATREMGTRFKLRQSPDQFARPTITTPLSNLSAQFKKFNTLARAQLSLKAKLSRALERDPILRQKLLELMRRIKTPGQRTAIDQKMLALIKKLLVQSMREQRLKLAQRIVLQRLKKLPLDLALGKGLAKILKSLERERGVSRQDLALFKKAINALLLEMAGGNKLLARQLMLALTIQEVLIANQMLQKRRQARKRRLRTSSGDSEAIEELIAELLHLLGSDDKDGASEEDEQFKTQILEDSGYAANSTDTTNGFITADNVSPQWYLSTVRTMAHQRSQLESDDSSETELELTETL